MPRNAGYQISLAQCHKLLTLAQELEDLFREVALTQCHTYCYYKECPLDKVEGEQQPTTNASQNTGKAE